LPVQVPVPSVGSVGGMTVGDTLAYAAVEYTVPLQSGGESIDPDSLRAVLTFTLDSQTTLALGSGDILACPTSNALWAAGGDQPSSLASPYDCSPGVGVTGNYYASTHTLTFDLSSAQEYIAPSGPTGIFSLALVPGSSPTGPFTAVIEPPSATSFSLTEESPLLGAASSLGSAGGSSDLGSSGSGLGSIASLPFSGGDNFVLPAPSGTASAAGTGAGATGSAAAAPSAAAASGTPAAETVAQGLGSGSQRTIAVILLVALAVGLWMAASTNRRQPKSLRVVHGDPEHS
jgi:hypothetical protein